MELTLSRAPLMHSPWYQEIWQPLECSIRLQTSFSSVGNSPLRSSRLWWDMLWPSMEGSCCWIVSSLQVRCWLRCCHFSLDSSYPVSLSAFSIRQWIQFCNASWLILKCPMGIRITRFIAHLHCHWWLRRIERFTRLKKLVSVVVAALDVVLLMMLTPHMNYSLLSMQLHEKKFNNII